MELNGEVSRNSRCEGKLLMLISMLLGFATAALLTLPQARYVPSSGLQLDTTPPQQAPVGADPYAAAAGGAAPGDADSSATDASAADSSQEQYGGAKFQKMLEQFQKTQKEIQKVEDHFQKKVGELQSSLTWAHLRPAMKKSWTCSIDCADKGKADDFASCLQKCNEPSQQQQNALQNYMQQIVQQDQQCSEGCMEKGGQNGDSDQQLHCHTKCAKEVEKQLPDYKDQIEKFMAHPQQAQI